MPDLQRIDVKIRRNTVGDVAADVCIFFVIVRDIGGIEEKVRILLELLSFNVVIPDPVAPLLLTVSFWFSPSSELAMAVSESGPKREPILTPNSPLLLSE